MLHIVGSSLGDYFQLDRAYESLRGLNLRLFSIIGSQRYRFCFEGGTFNPQSKLRSHGENCKKDEGVTGLGRLRGAVPNKRMLVGLLLEYEGLCIIKGLFNGDRSVQRTV